MPTRRIKDDYPYPSPCRDSEHDPPSMMVFKDGLHEHECPTCGHKQRFRVSHPSLGTLMRVDAPLPLTGGEGIRSARSRLGEF